MQARTADNRTFAGNILGRAASQGPSYRRDRHVETGEPHFIVQPFFEG